MIKKIYFIILLLTIHSMVYGSDYENFWGNEKNSFIAKYKADTYIVFRAKDEPEYKNRIIDFFTSMNSKDRVDITVVRINGKPEIDYCFFNEKLYSISEDWGDIDTGTAGKLIQNIQKKYTSQSTEKKNAELILSFKKNKTKVLFQQTANSNSTVRVKIFYYTMDMFRSLFYE